MSLPSHSESDRFKRGHSRATKSHATHRHGNLGDETASIHEEISISPVSTRKEEKDGLMGEAVRFRNCMKIIPFGGKNMF